MSRKELKAVLQGNEEFTKNLYTILAKIRGNIFFSPISIHAILSLAYQGARGGTQEAFSKILKVPNVRVAALGYKDIMSHLNSVKDVTLLIANKVFLQENYKFHEAFNTVAVQQFRSEVGLLDFKQSKVAASSINTWVESKTNKKIKEVIDPDDITDDTALVLVNAIYFKGEWAYPFYIQNTKTEKFFINNVDTIDVQMMHITYEDFFYKVDASLNAKVLKLPYSNKEISLIVVLPIERNGIAELEEKLAGTDITKLTENMCFRKINLAFPKFKIEQAIDLKNSLTELGLGVIFRRNDADLSGIIEGTDGLYVAKVVQKAFIEVNEEGSEATAAAKMACTLRCYIPPEEFTADHPFLVILQARQDETTNILFVGRISKPQY